MASTRFDWLVIALAGWILGGLYLDGWAHIHVLELDTFFTPWHGLLYSGMLAVAVFLAASAARYHAGPDGSGWRRSLPFGYGWSLLGVALFGVGGVGDMVWHLVFGIEQGVDALLSPTHLWLAFAGVMIGTGPLRSAWHKAGPASYRAVWPALLSLAYLLSVLTFFTQFAHPLVEPLAAQRQTVIASEIHVMAADGSGQTRLIATAEKNNVAASWSPDGRRMAFASDRDGTSQIYVSDGAAIIRLTSGDAPNSYPAFSPDGSKIAFISQRDGRPEVYLMNADGTEQTRLSTSGALAWPPSWSPDGRRLAFSSVQAGQPRVHILSIDGSGETVIVESLTPGLQPSLSPDGTNVAFTTGVGEKADIHGGLGLARLTSGNGPNLSPAWSPDGERIAFVSRRDGNSEVYVMNADGSGQTNLTNTPGVDEWLPSWSADGSRIVYSAQSRAAALGSFGQALGIASILLQTGLLMGTLLLGLRRWTLPLGSVTLLFTLNAALMGMLNDRLPLVPAVVVAGMVGDALLRGLRPGPERRGALRVFAFTVPAVLYGLYFLSLALTDGVRWPVELWVGSIVIAGLTGLLVSYVLVGLAEPATQPQQS
ncbi:MAG: PD40 domain-containing protein [Chloroflexi bacterium]|nr:PD40 domain-containing protein [Chloroflexota bacterium]